MLMKIGIAAVVALGCALAVPGASLAAGDKDKSAASTAADTNSAKPSKATAQHKKPKKGFSDDAHDLPYYTGGQQGEERGPARGQARGQVQRQPQGQAR